MPELKLGKLPDRTPVKIAITVSPDLNQALRDYAATYGEGESVADLIPFMLSSFLDSDRGFAKARKEAPIDPPVEPARQRRARRSPSEPSSTTSQEE